MALLHTLVRDLVRVTTALKITTDHDFVTTKIYAGMKPSSIMADTRRFPYFGLAQISSSKTTFVLEDQLPQPQPDLVISEIQHYIHPRAYGACAPALPDASLPSPAEINIHEALTREALASGVSRVPRQRSARSGCNVHPHVHQLVCSALECIRPRDSATGYARLASTWQPWDGVLGST